jgi:hypothetical protein
MATCTGLAFTLRGVSSATQVNCVTTNPAINSVGCDGKTVHGPHPASPPPILRRLINPCSVGRVPDNWRNFGHDRTACPLNTRMRVPETPPEAAHAGRGSRSSALPPRRGYIEGPRVRPASHREGLDVALSEESAISVRRSPKASCLLLRTALEHGTAGGATRSHQSLGSRPHDE